MKLSDFLQSLLTEGHVAVAGDLLDFDKEDLRTTLELLSRYYQEAALEMPYEAPSFAPAAALWAAQFFYKAVQLTVLRDLDESQIEHHLQAFSQPRTAEAIFSVDLTFRYLPNLLGLARGMAPSDFLVEKLKTTLTHWHFSAVGLEIEENPPLGTIFEHPSLRMAFVERVLEKNDKKLLARPDVQAVLAEMAGAQGAALNLKLSSTH